MNKRINDDNEQNRITQTCYNRISDETMKIKRDGEQKVRRSFS